MIKWTCRSNIKSSLAREDVALYARNYKKDISGLYEQNLMLVLRRDVPCVSEVIFLI